MMTTGYIESEQKGTEIGILAYLGLQLEWKGGGVDALYRGPCKCCGKFTAVDHLSLEVGRGRYLDL